MEFNFSNRTVADWRELLLQSHHANWMQSFPYAKASYLRDYKPTRLITLSHKGGPIGFMALQEIKLGPVHFLDLNRGPLWFSNSVTESEFLEFSELFQDTYPQRWMQRRRWLPEWENSESAQKLLNQAGFQQMPQTFQTIWLDLEKPAIELRKDLHQKWRNALNKAERSSTEIQVDWKAPNLEHFLKRYDYHKALKGFHGVTSAFIREEIRYALPFQEAMILWARHQGEICAGAYFLIHGNTLSYRIGWNTALGRQQNAHYLLLWKALEAGQTRKLKAFDLGGITPQEAQGVSRFKQGLGGTEKKLLGLFR